MPKTFMLALAMLCATAMVQAQDSPQNQQNRPSSIGGAANGQSDMSRGSGGQTSVEGCLQGSNGSYTITDSTGTTYQLTGETGKLSKHVGHEVEITGSTSGSSAANSGNTMSSGSQNSLKVQKVKMVSSSCSNSMSK